MVLLATDVKRCHESGGGLLHIYGNSDDGGGDDVTIVQEGIYPDKCQC